LNTKEVTTLVEKRNVPVVTLSRSRSKKLTTGLIFVVLCISSVLFLLPFIWMLSTALKTPSEAVSKDIHIIPEKWMWSNFSDALKTVPFIGYVENSLIVAFFAVILTVFINCLAGYAFAKYEFKGRNILFLMVLSTLMIPPQITMVPNFYILKWMDWINTYSGLIIPRAAEAFGLFLARQYMMNIPNELIEAARMDGASEFTIFRKVILPNVKPLIAVLIIFTFMWRWNDLIWPLIVVSDKSMYTVQLGLVIVKGEHYINWTILMCLTLLSIIPIMIVFFIFQRYFVQGMVSSGMKE
jgi:alpha-1,4-digalacturonate transport system permease protein